MCVEDGVGVSVLLSIKDSELASSAVCPCPITSLCCSRVLREKRKQKKLVVQGSDTGKDNDTSSAVWIDSSQKYCLKLDPQHGYCKRNAVCCALGC